PVTRPITEESFDELRQVARCDRHALEAGPRELADHDVEDRPVADRHQWLGQDCRIRLQTGAKAPSEGHGAQHPPDAYDTPQRKKRASPRSAPPRGGFTSGGGTSDEPSTITRGMMRVK